jgi:hypothetical protein
MTDIKEYKSKSSVLKVKSRYVQGGDTEINKKRLGWWERDEIPRNDVTDILITIDSRYFNRPDLIAFDYYGFAELAWIVLQYNNIVDVKDELILGKEITIPSADRVFFEILTNTIKVQESRI